MQIISNIALISINETMVIQLISFLIFVFIINRVMFRPLRDTMDERENYIEGLKRNVDDTEIELDAVTKKLEIQESMAKQEAFEKKTALEDEGKDAAQEIFSEIRQEISIQKEAALKEVDTQIAEARKHLEDESKMLAAIIIDKVLDRRLAR